MSRHRFPHFKSFSLIHDKSSVIQWVQFDRCCGGRKDAGAVTSATETSPPPTLASAVGVSRCQAISVVPAPTGCDVQWRQPEAAREGPGPSTRHSVVPRNTCTDCLTHFMEISRWVLILILRAGACIWLKSMELLKKCQVLGKDQWMVLFSLEILMVIVLLSVQ